MFTQRNLRGLICKKLSKQNYPPKYNTQVKKENTEKVALIFGNLNKSLFGKTSRLFGFVLWCQVGSPFHKLAILF